MEQVLPIAKLVSDERSKRNLSIRDFARLVGVTHPTISAVIAGEQPSYDLCEKLAPVLHLSLEATLIAAGRLPSISPDDARVENWREILRLLTPEEEAELREIGLLKIKRRQAASRINQARKQPPGDDD